jgi:hypothetical protein
VIIAFALKWSFGPANDELLGAEIVGLEHLANLDLGITVREWIGTALDPLDCFLQRLHLEEPEAGDQLLGFGEGAVDNGPLVS